MTTNHKPTFESRRARDPYASGGSGILHGRAEQKKLKYRKIHKGEDVTQHRKKLDELKQELKEREGGDVTKGLISDVPEGNVSTNDNYDENEEFKSRSIEESKIKEEKDQDKEGSHQDNEEENDSDNGSDSDSDSDNDEELLRELQHLKQAQQKEKEQESQAKSQPETSKPLKKSWRQSQFRNKPASTTNASAHVNDMMKSNSHKDFMSKHIR